jgi:hypothetical protein
MNKKYLEIHIRGSGLSFKSNGNNLLDLNVPLNILDNMEILDPLAFEKLTVDSINTNNIKPQKANLFLSNEIIFNKIVKTSEEEKDFFDQVPLEPDNLVKKTIDIKDAKIAIAVSKRFIDNIKLILEKTGFKIVSIAPEAESIQNLIDFGENESEKTEIPLFNKIALILFFVSLISLSMLFFFIKRPLIKIEIVGTTPTPVSIPTPQITQPPLLNKSNIKIQILNKTKIAGLAKKVGNLLSDFPNIELGNIDAVDTQTTNVTFSPQIGELDKKSVFKILESMLVRVASSEAKTKNDFDIIIEVGEPS